MSEDVWLEDARTDRAIELLRVCGAKTNADGEVVPTYRYSRNFIRVAEHLRDFIWGSKEESVMISKTGDPETRRSIVEVSIEVVMEDGSQWRQEGVASSDDDSYDWHALAACRALLNYTQDDGEPMSPGEVITMLEDRRSRALGSEKRASA